MATTNHGGHGGSHDQHVHAGEQSHKNSGNSSAPNTRKAADTDTDNGPTGGRGGTHEQHVKAGQQSHKSS